MDIANLPPCFYRVTAKALVFDTSGRLLVQINKKGGYELPGGGIEYGESVQQALSREIKEELGVELESVGELRGIWYGKSLTCGNHKMRLAFKVALQSTDFSFGDGMVKSEWLTRDEFLGKDWKFEGDVSDIEKIIWGETLRS